MLSHYDENLEIGSGILNWRFTAPDGETLVPGENTVGVRALIRATRLKPSKTSEHFFSKVTDEFDKISKIKSEIFMNRNLIAAA